MKTMYFFDSGLVKKLTNAKNIPGKLDKCENNPLFIEGLYDTPCLPWEIRFDNGYPNVFYDPLIEKYRCYYTGIVYDECSSNTPLCERQHLKYRPTNERITALLYAESTDGIHWVKPELDIVEYMGTRKNNILGLYLHGASVMLDRDEKDDTKRYKMIVRDDHLPKRLCVAYSPDGIHFSDLVYVDAQVPGDTHNFVLYNRGKSKYILYTRLFTRELRTVGYLESVDFVHWDNLKEVLAGNGLDDQFYAMPVFFKDGLYFGLGAVFHAGDETLSNYDHVDVELCYSGDGIRWQRIAPGVPFIANGAGEYGHGDCDAGCCFASVPVEDGEDYRFYYMGGNGTHYNFRETSLCMARINMDKLAGIAARNPDKPLGVRTIKLRFLSEKLFMSADVENGGYIRYEILDKNGLPVAGYELENCCVIEKGGTSIPLSWNTDRSLPQEGILQFVCDHATLYKLTGDYELLPIHPI